MELAQGTAGIPHQPGSMLTRSKLIGSWDDMRIRSGCPRRFNFAHPRTLEGTLDSSWGMPPWIETGKLLMRPRNSFALTQSFRPKDTFDL